MSEMTHELNQMHERAAITKGLFAVTITAENDRLVPTVIIVTDTLNAEQQEKAREHLWAIAGILHDAYATNA